LRRAPTLPPYHSLVAVFPGQHSSAQGGLHLGCPTPASHRQHSCALVLTHDSHSPAPRWTVQPAGNTRLSSIYTQGHTSLVVQWRLACAGCALAIQVVTAPQGNGWRRALGAAAALCMEAVHSHKRW
jgi:hypothetical protein